MNSVNNDTERAESSGLSPENSLTFGESSLEISSYTPWTSGL